MSRPKDDVTVGLSEPGPGSQERKVGPCPTPGEVKHARGLLAQWRHQYGLRAGLHVGQKVTDEIGAWESPATEKFLAALGCALSVRYVRLEEAEIARLRKEVKAEQYEKAWDEWNLACMTCPVRDTVGELEKSEWGLMVMAQVAQNIAARTEAERVAAAKAAVEAAAARKEARRAAKAKKEERRAAKSKNQARSRKVAPAPAGAPAGKRPVCRFGRGSRGPGWRNKRLVPRPGSYRPGTKAGRND